MAQPSDAARREQAPYEDQLAEARERYDALRSRKAVCAALALADLRRRAAALLRHNGHRVGAARRATRATPYPAPAEPRTPALEPSLAVEVAHC